jgi:uncharacterized protein (TIGR02996 family)
MSEPNPRRRFEFKSETSYKFWTCQQIDQVVETSYGRIGNKGTLSQKGFASFEEAEQFAAKKVREKLKAGYQEVIRKQVDRKSNAELWEELKDHEPFLQAILEAPDEEDGYLVYADWLMERGDPRGDYMLCQWKLADYETPLREIESLEKKASEIYSSNWRGWLGELGKYTSESKLSIQFGRGLADIAVFKTASSDLAKCLSGSPHARTIRQLQFLNRSAIKPSMVADVQQAHEILADADFGNVRHFAPGAGVPTKLAKATFALIKSFPRLQKITLNDSFQAKDLPALFQVQIPSLNHLKISEQNGGETVNHLCRSNWLEQLETIELQCNLSDAVCQRLAESLDPIQIQTLFVSSSIGEQSINLFEKHDINVIPE